MNTLNSRQVFAHLSFKYKSTFRHSHHFHNKSHTCLYNLRVVTSDTTSNLKYVVNAAAQLSTIFSIYSNILYFQTLCK